MTPPPLAGQGLFHRDPKDIFLTRKTRLGGFGKTIAHPAQWPAGWYTATASAMAWAKDCGCRVRT